MFLLLKLSTYNKISNWVLILLTSMHGSLMKKFIYTYRNAVDQLAKGNT